MAVGEVVQVGSLRRKPLPAGTLEAIAKAKGLPEGQGVVVYDGPRVGVSNVIAAAEAEGLRISQQVSEDGTQLTLVATILTDADRAKRAEQAAKRAATIAAKKAAQGA